MTKTNTLNQLWDILRHAEEQLALAYQETAYTDFLKTSLEAGRMCEIVSYEIYKQQNGQCH